MLELIDSHSHLDASEFDADRSDVLSRARAAGVTRQILPAVAFDTFPALRDLCARESGLYPAYGLHPLYLDKHRPQHLDELAGWLEREQPVAVGECGLDFFVAGLDPESQRTLFHQQLEIAKGFDLPLILHARRALDEVIAAIRRIGGVRGVVHSFSGSAEQAAQLWKCGFHLGIGGPVTYPRARRLREIVATMPIEYLLLETDSPDQPLHGHQGARNEPARLTEVCVAVADLRGVSAAGIAAATAHNAECLFNMASSNSST
ncbi:MAG: TatD family hydrolase [Rudaea sp.]